MALTDFLLHPLASPLNFLLTTSIVLTIYLTTLSIYRLFFHPLHNIPGPRHAALTHLYQFYFDVVLRGRFLWYIADLHKKHGPIVRIGPNEVHILDPEFYHVLYTTGSQKRDKVYFALGGFGLPDAVLMTVGHDVHRMRRAALAGYFSTKAISNMEPVVREKLELLARRIGEVRGTNQWVDIEAATMSLTTDLITEYCFGVSNNFLEKPGFAPEWSRIIMGASEISNFGRYAQWLPRLMAKMPLSVVRMMDASLVPLVVFTKDQQEQVRKVKAASGNPDRSSDKPSIIRELLESNLPASEKLVARVAEEAQVLVAAGSSTTVHFLKTTIYFILADRTIHTRLKAELKSAFPDSNEIPPLHKLEQLSYFNAVVKEGSRMTHGVSSRMARVAPDQDLKFGKHILPRGTEIGMTNFLQHTNPEVFPDPDEFRPDRWLEDPKLERHLVNFSRGARSCLGINLAKVEMYLTLAVLFQRFDMELFETDRSDVELAHDFFIPYARTDSKGVRMLVK